MDGRGGNHYLRVGRERAGLIEDLNHRLDRGNSAVALPVATNKSLKVEDDGEVIVTSPVSRMMSEVQQFVTFHTASFQQNYLDNLL